MKKYALLCHPGLNRVYAQQAAALGAQELQAVAGVCNLAIKNVEPAHLAGIDYLMFECENEADSAQLHAIARLSVFFALFERVQDNTLKPVEAKPSFAFAENLVTLLKYSGKTNEQFTHLMVHVAQCASRSRRNQTTKAWLLDPLCGKGTTLYTAMRFGFNAVGVELHDTWVHEAQNFLKQYFERGFYKHKRVIQKQMDAEHRKIADLTSYSYALDKESFKRQDFMQVQVVRADTLLANQILPHQRFDFLVTDLPYGIQHGSHNAQAAKTGLSNFTRNAVSLVDKALDGWINCLKNGASIVLAYNALTTPGEKLTQVLEKHQLTIINDKGFTGYKHHVDQSIERDLIIARKEI